MTRTGTYFDTLAPDAISEELTPIVQELGLAENCRQLAMEGWTVVENAADEHLTNSSESRSCKTLQKAVQECCCLEILSMRKQFSIQS